MGAGKSHSSIHLRCLMAVFWALIGAARLYYRNYKSYSNLLFLTPFHDALLHLSSLSFFYPFNAIWFNNALLALPTPIVNELTTFLSSFLTFFFYLSLSFSIKSDNSNMQHVNVKASAAAHIAEVSFISVSVSLFLFLSCSYIHISNLISLTQFFVGYILKASICYGNVLSKMLPSAWHVNSFMTVWRYLLTRCFSLVFCQSIRVLSTNWILMWSKDFFFVVLRMVCCMWGDYFNVLL